MSLTEPVRAFHEKHGLRAVDVPSLDPIDVMMRCRLIDEEFAEMKVALQRAVLEPDNVLEHLVDALDGMADLIYVIAGTAVSCGLPLDDAYAEVCRSNLTKTPLDEGKKGGKGPGYEPPRIAALLMSRIPTFARLKQAIEAPAKEIPGTTLADLSGEVAHEAVVARNNLRRLVVRRCSDCGNQWIAPSPTGDCPRCRSRAIVNLGESHTEAPRV